MIIFDGPEGSSRITLLGHGLDVELLEGIKAQKVSVICELADLDAAAALRVGEPAVTGIGIKGGGREWSRAAGPAR